MKQEQAAEAKKTFEAEERRPYQDAPILCPVCLHPIPYSKKFQCRRCGYMPG